MEIRSDIEIAVVGRGYIVEWNIGGHRYRRVCTDTLHFSKVMRGVIAIVRGAQARTVERDQHHAPEGGALMRSTDAIDQPVSALNLDGS